MEVKYSPADYKPEKAGPKYKIDLNLYISSMANSTEATIWGNSEEEVLAKTAKFLDGATPLN